MDLFSTAGVDASLVQGGEIRKWKVSMSGMFAEIPDITEWNYFVIEKETLSSSDTVTLKVKSSVTHDDYVVAFPQGATKLDLLRQNVPLTRPAIPTYNQSAAVDVSMQKPLQGVKLRNIAEMYSSYIPENRWPAQLKTALQSTQVSSSSADEQQSIPRNSHYDAQAVRIMDQLGNEESAAIAHTYLSRTHGANSINDEELVKKVQSYLDFGIRTLPRRKKAKLNKM